MKVWWRHQALCASLLFAVGLAFAPSSVAEEKAAETEAAAPAGDLTSMWLVTPKAGSEMAFEKAMKDFVAWRKKNGDPFTWDVFTVVIGSDLRPYAIRSNSHHWKDEDAEQAWEEKHAAYKQYREKLAPHVASVSHLMDEFNPELSRWNFEGQAKYIGVSTVKVLPGQWSKVKAAVSAFKKAADEQKWTESWAVMHGVGGEGGLMFAWPYKDYAGMEEPEIKASAMLAKSLGSEEKAGELMASYGSSVKTVDYTVWAYRPDLSTQK